VRWRFVDRVTDVEPWKRAIVRKAISLEEYSLLKPFGRKGEFPESLVLECCVEAVRWLVAASSEFTQTCVLGEVSEFRFQRIVGMGDRLEIAPTVRERGEKEMRIECRVMCSGTEAARGQISVVLSPLSESFDADWIKGNWREIYGAA